MKNPAQYIQEATQEIMLAWKKLVKQRVPASQRTNALALYDHLPNVILNIGQILVRTNNGKDLHEDDTFPEILQNSIYHGRHRAITQEYTIEQVIHEYILFHRILTEALTREGLYDEKIADVLKYVIETAILKSAGSFSSAIQEMQEKLIGTLAHDLRNPLTAAQLSLEMMETDVDDAWFQRMKSTTARSVKKALSLIEGLMDAITIRAGEGITLNFEEMDIAESIAWVHKEATEIYSQEVLLSRPKGKIMGVFDETAVRRLLENLITNAIKYGDGKSPVKIKLSDDQDSISISVHNSGNSIPKEKQEHMFDFLSRDNENSATYKSWGMGLALVKMVAEAHDGDIGLTSDDHEGTYFKAVLQKNSNIPGKKKARLNDKAAPGREYSA